MKEPKYSKGDLVFALWSPRKALKIKGEPTFIPYISYTQEHEKDTYRYRLEIGYNRIKNVNEDDLSLKPIILNKALSTLGSKRKGPVTQTLFLRMLNAVYTDIYVHPDKALKSFGYLIGKKDGHPTKYLFMKHFYAQNLAGFLKKFDPKKFQKEYEIFIKTNAISYKPLTYEYNKKST